MSEPEKTCTWYQDGDDSDVWATECSEFFCIIEDTPKENGFKYCCYCGKPLEESLHEDEKDE